MTDKHKVFIAYHHANDQRAKDRFVRDFSEAFDGFVDHSVPADELDTRDRTDEDIAREIRDNYIGDATVTIVLVGQQTWQRRHVDWELRSALRRTTRNSRTGLLGILLRSYQLHPESLFTMQPSTPDRRHYWPYDVPPVLWRNIEAGYATMRPYPESGEELKAWVHEAFMRRTKQPDPTLAGQRFVRNRSSDRW